MKLKIIAIVILMGSFLSFYSGTASAGVDEALLINSVNTQRVVRGLPELVINDELTMLSIAWSQTLAKNKALSHSELPIGVTQTWKKLGENVGSGSTISTIAAALVASPTHLENMIDPDFTTIGVGISVSGSTLYVVQKFMQLSEQIFSKPLPTTTQPPPVVTLPPTTTIPIPPSTTTDPVATTVPPTTTVPQEPKIVSEVQRHGVSKLKEFVLKIMALVRRILNR